MVIEQHGDHAPMFVAERIGALAVAGDQAGVDTWQAIAIAKCIATSIWRPCSARALTDNTLPNWRPAQQFTPAAR
jgi:hypothetical protein